MVVDTLTIGEWISRANVAAERLSYGEADVRWICEEILRLTPALLRLDRNRPLTPDEQSRLDAALEKRLNGMPVQYIFSRAPFMGFTFYVDEDVLIPRMDTEVLCEESLRFLRTLPAPEMLDLCAGSGCVGLSLKRLCPKARVTLSDISPGASRVQKINAKKDDAEILTGDLFATVDGRRFDLIACNPPYIETSELDLLDEEVKKEPALALDGGADGLAIYRRLAKEYRDHLYPGGRLYMEIGYNQSESVGNLFPGSRLIRDMNGLPRVICAK